MKNKRFFRMIVCAALAIGLVFAGCDTGTNGGGGTNTGGGNNTGGDDYTGGDDNTGGGDYTGGGNNTGGGSNTGGGDYTGGNNTGGGSNTGSGSTGGDNTFTPPAKAQLSEFLESQRTNTANEIAGENAAVYIKSITVNTYTIGGTSITANPAAVPENADVKVKFTIRTILGFNQLTMGERLQIDNFRVDLIDALQSWLKEQGFKNVPSANITTGDTVFG